MKNNSYNSSRKTKGETKLSLADVKKLSQSQYRLSLADAYEIVAGYKDITAPSPELAKVIYARAMRMVQKDDAEFAKSLKDLARSEQHTSLKDMISLSDAYDIISGDKSVDKDAYFRALKLLKKEDPEFLKYVQEYKMYCTELEKSAKEHSVFTEDIVQNIETITSLSNDTTVQDEVFNNDEIRELVTNTPVIGEDGIEITSEEVRESVINQARVDSTAILANTPDFAQASNDLQRERVVEEMKRSVKKTFFGIRLKAVQKAFSNTIQAVKSGSHSFFKNKVSKLRDVFNPKKKVVTSVQTLAAEEKKSMGRAKAFLRKVGTYATLSLVALSSLTQSCTPFMRNNSSQKDTEPKATKTVTLENTAKTSAAIVSDSIPNDTISVLNTTPKTVKQDIKTNTLNTLAADSVKAKDVLDITDLFAAETAKADTITAT
ncbi:MAG: hypothetical protein NC218_04940, partial [Acetobacter sp.]|nr:hypothetical protein [Acetobacter sp.]